MNAKTSVNFALFIVAQNDRKIIEIKKIYEKNENIKLNVAYPSIPTLLSTLSLWNFYR